MTGLILVEGLPGSGKTATAGFVKEILDECGGEARLFLEGDLDHPADMESVAFLSEGDFSILQNQYGELFAGFTRESNSGFLVFYGKMRRAHEDGIPEELLAQLAKHDVYELSFAKNRSVITENWKRFADKAAVGDTIYVFECAFIQNPVTVGMIKYGEDEVAVQTYIELLAKAVEPLEPLLVYVGQQDIEASFRKAADERPAEWLRFFTDYYTSQGYGKTHRLEGLEGAIEILKARQTLETAIYNQLSINKTIIDNTTFNPGGHKAQLKKLLSEQLG
ncbi:hypothetical protein [Bacillus sp. B-jedd]|uniref:hypothetical protein n=1 Tax=Bacillus sp. B-jedd TaxID=1476857 RepID=UPI000515578E|nr:hypothetical protein [Bacillus sp. B-jedd]CEG28550.1 Hypothetical protein BN1002_03472 [Bacillus sp. B-jedd]